MTPEQAKEIKLDAQLAEADWRRKAIEAQYHAQRGGISSDLITPTQLENLFATANRLARVQKELDDLRILTHRDARPTSETVKR